MFYSSGALACLLPPFLKRRVSLTRKPITFFSLYCIFFFLTYFFLRISFYPIHLLELKKLWAGADGGGGGGNRLGLWGMLGFPYYFFCPCAEFFHGNDMSFGGFRDNRSSTIVIFSFLILAGITSSPHAPS